MTSKLPIRNSQSSFKQKRQVPTQKKPKPKQRRFFFILPTFTSTERLASVFVAFIHCSSKTGTKVCLAVWTLLHPCCPQNQSVTPSPPPRMPPFPQNNRHYGQLNLRNRCNNASHSPVFASKLQQVSARHCSIAQSPGSGQTFFSRKLTAVARPSCWTQKTQDIILLLA